jgi:hypothetical protein
VPLVFIAQGFRFFFYSNEGDPREPAHIHVRKDRSIAKFWIDPEVKLADAYGFSAKELNKISRIIDNRKTEIRGAWDEHFNA